MPVTAEYGELPNGDVPNVPFVKTSGVWDTERSLAKRVNYALIKFTPGSISKFNGTFQVDYVKHLLEQIRRRVHPLWGTNNAKEFHILFILSLSYLIFDMKYILRYIFINSNKFIA